MRRLWIIPMLILAGLPRLGVVVFSGGDLPDSCAIGGCCEMIEAVDRGGQRVVTEVCMMSGGACQCEMSPSENPEPSPRAPMPTVGSELVLGLPGERGGVETSLFAHDSRRVARFIGWHGSARRHNETQALLGVWRT